MSEIVHHTHQPATGGVHVKYETNSRGTNVSVSIDRPREEGETFEVAAQHALALALATYKQAREAVADGA